GASEDWLLNFPRGFAYLLTWVILLLFIRLSKITDPLHRNIPYGLACVCIIPFVFVFLTSGAFLGFIWLLEPPFSCSVGSVVSLLCPRAYNLPHYLGRITSGCALFFNSAQASTKIRKQPAMGDLATETPGSYIELSYQRKVAFRNLALTREHGHSRVT